MRSCLASSVTDTSPCGKGLDWSRRTQWCGSLSQVTDDTWRSVLSSLCPSRKPGSPASSVTDAAYPQSLLPRARIPLANSRSDFGADWELTRRIDSSPASVCAPTVSVGRCALGFRWRGGCFHAGAETNSIPLPLSAMCVCARWYTGGWWASCPRTCTPSLSLFSEELLFVTNAISRASLVSLFILSLE